jgi:hypothetical protein
MPRSLNNLFIVRVGYASEQYVIYCILVIYFFGTEYEGVKIMLITKSKI